MKKKIKDEELVARFIQSQDERYFSELYNRYRRKVYHSCYQLLSDSEEAQDQTQEIFCKVLARLAGFRQECTFSTWLYRLTHNHCFSVRRQSRMQLRISLESLGDLEDDLVNNSPTLDERWDLAEQVLAQLPAKDEHLLKVRYFIGEKIEDLALQYHVGISAMKMRLKRARDMARLIQQQQRLQ